MNAELLRRFAQEANALGRLQHPGIAQIYEAGIADTGYGPQPYFVMEFIAGRSLLEFAEERHLNSRARLHLMWRELTIRRPSMGGRGASELLPKD